MTNSIVKSNWLPFGILVEHNRLYETPKNETPKNETPREEEEEDLRMFVRLTGGSGDDRLYCESTLQTFCIMYKIV